MAYVASNTGYNSGPITLTGASAGNTLVAFVSGDSSQASTSLPAGWEKQTPSTLANSVTVCAWVYPNWTGGNVSAAITSGPTDPGWSIHEYSGRDTTTPVEAYQTTNTTGATFTTATVTVTAGADVFVAVAQELAAGTPTFTTSGYQKRTEQTTHVHGTGDKINASAGSENCSGSPGANVGHATMILSLKAASGGTTARQPRRRQPALTYR